MNNFESRWNIIRARQFTNLTRGIGRGMHIHTRESAMPVWIQEAIACVSMLIFLASVTLLAAADPERVPALYAGDWQATDRASP